MKLADSNDDVVENKRNIDLGVIRFSEYGILEG